MMLTFAGVDFVDKAYVLKPKPDGGWDASDWFGVKPPLAAQNALMNLPYIKDSETVIPTLCSSHPFASNSSFLA